MIIYVDDIPVDVELADCDPTRQLGLMYRHHLPENTGMLFSWPDESIRSFWMKNTTLPLSIAYISSTGRVLNIEDLNPLDLTSVASTAPAAHALEMNRGWFTKNGITPGSRIRGLVESKLLSESAEFNLSDPDFYYREVVEGVVDDILASLSDGFREDTFTNTYLWDYPISPDIWAEYYADDGSAFFDVNVQIIPTAFEEGHPGWNIDATAGWGESSEASVEVLVQFSKDLVWAPEMLDRIQQELFNAIPHEIHHLTQDGKPFERPNCPATPPAESDSYFHYFSQACEVPSFLIGFRGEAGHSGLAIGKLIDSYLNNYINVGKINQDEAEEIKGGWLGHDVWEREAVQERLIRNYVRALLIEATELPAEYFSAIDDAVTASQFWTEENSQEAITDYDVPQGGMLGTPAITALQAALQSAFNGLGLDIDILVTSHYTEDFEGMTLHPDHPAWPNRWLVDAKWYVSKERPGRNTIDLELMTSEDEDDITSSLDPSALVRHITQTVRHELVHYHQMKKQAKSKELDEMATFKEMLADPSQVPDRNKPEFWEVWEPTGKVDGDGDEIINKEGWKHKEYTQAYLRSHIEIDAHAHDGAEELLAVYGKDASMDMLRHGFNVSDPQMPNAIKHYFEMLPEDDSALDKFRKKLFTQLEKMSID